MLTAEQIAALRDAFGSIADPINDFLIKDIARRVAGAGQLTSSAAYQIYRAQQLGLSEREIRDMLKKELKVGNARLKELLTQSAEVGYNFDVKWSPKATPFEKNTSLQQIVKAAVELAKEDFANITQTLGMVGPDGVAYPLQDTYCKCMDYAFEQVFTGATDYNTAIRRATKNLADQGVRVIDYESGIHTGLDAAVRRNIMGGLGLMQEQISQKNHDELGADGWEISAHAASAPDHEPIQGKQYADAEYQALNNSLQRRIGTLNCGHAAFPIILGVQKPQYTPEQLRQLREDNEAGIIYQGRHYTMYEATQMQRKVERSIRREKNRVLVAEATGDKERLTTSQIRLRRLNDEYGRFSKAAGLPTQRERAQVTGFGRGQAARAEVTYRRQKSIVDSFTESMGQSGITVRGFEEYTGDAKTLGEMQFAFSKLSKEFPDEAKGLTVVLGYSPGKDDYGWFDSKTKAIHYNREMLKNWTRLEQDYAELVKVGHFPAGTDARGCFYHEFGHVVWNARSGQSARKPIDSVLQRLGYGYQNKAQRELALARELSGYAITDTTPAYQEVIAEAFSEWYTSDKPRRFCDELLREVGIK